MNKYLIKIIQEYINLEQSFKTELLWNTYGITIYLEHNYYYTNHRVSFGIRIYGKYKIKSGEEKQRIYWSICGHIY